MCPQMIMDDAHQSFASKTELADEQLANLLRYLYGEIAFPALWRQVISLMDEFCNSVHPQSYCAGSLSEKDAILITYGDSFTAPAEPPLETLARFAARWLNGGINGIHILPLFPFSSDDGFSVIDYRSVNPDLGTWADISRLGAKYRLMFDMVINHVSQYSDWFQAYLRGEPPYTGYFITTQPEWDLSLVVRPRTLPLTTRFDTTSGSRQVWTTFSPDQVDLNYANPQVLIEAIALLLDYVSRGAGIIRLDAIAYLWKEPGTTCIHHPKTHLVVKVLRRVLDLVAPQVIIITETNVPHIDNISYFGARDEATGRTDEAQLVYQFPLAPLILHSYYTQNAERLSEWAASLGEAGMFFNFIASHDGIGVRPVRDLLSEGEIQQLVERTLAHGGKVSCKSDADGTQVPYELNITLYDALNNPQQPDQQIDMQRFLSTQVIMLSLAGVPGIYVHSLFGSRNCHPCFDESGRARSINREKFDYSLLEPELAQGSSRRARLFAAYRRLLELRRQEPAFHPQGKQNVLAVDACVFALARYAPGFAVSAQNDEGILTLVNVSPAQRSVRVDLRACEFHGFQYWRDLVGGKPETAVDGCLEMVLAPYQYVWLKPVLETH